MNIGQLKKEIENLNDDVEVRVNLTVEARTLEWVDVYECVESRSYNPEDESRKTVFNLMVGIDDIEITEEQP